MRPTLRAVGLFISGVLLALVASAAQSEELAGLAALALIAPLVAGAWVLLPYRRARSIDLIRTVVPQRPRVGEWATVTTTPATGRMPTWARVRERVRGARVDAAGSAGAYRLLPHRRGLLELGPAVVTRTDPLQLFSWVHLAERSTQVTVWPRTVPLFDEVRLWPDDAQVSDTAGRRQSTVDSVSLRDYQAGDDLRRVHWRASAHQGSLVVRPDEPRLDESVSLVVLLSATGSGEDPDPAVEWTVSAAASWATALLTTGYPVSLYLSPGPEGTTLTEPAEALDAFALADTAEVQLPDPGGRGALIAVVLSPSPRQVHDLARLGQSRDCRALVVDGQAGDLDRLAAAGWLVHAATSGTDITAAWNEALSGWSQQ
ncbi:MAG TPA: DUF58 domain-containing protein [Ruania sp.]|nr:DUF58 domain-containing protein [Ruania sp.]